jgi:4,5-dihydroxyphthalate decarboxylase
MKNAVYVSLPWLATHLEQTREVMGDDPFGYGLERNRQPLATFLRYALEQGLLASPLEPEDLFAPETVGLTDRGV